MDWFLLRERGLLCGESPGDGICVGVILVEMAADWSL